MKIQIHFLKSVLLTCFVATLLLLIFLPFLCDTYLLPRLIKQLPFDHKELSLSKISPWKIGGSLRLMQDDVVVATIPKFEIQYSPSALLKGEIDTVLLEAPSLFLKYTDGSLSVPGLPQKSDSTQSKTNSFPLELPVSIKEIIIRNSHITLQTETKKLNYFLNSRLQPGFTTIKDNTYKLSTLNVDMTTEGELALTSSTQFIFSPKGMLLNAKVNIPDLADMNNFLQKDAGVSLNGAIIAKGQIAISPQMNMSHCQINVNINTFRSIAGQTLVTQTSTENPVHIQIEGDQTKLNYSLSGLSVKEPEQITITATGTIDPVKKYITTKANIYSTRLKHPFTVDLNSNFGGKKTLADLHLTGDKFFINDDTSMGPLDVTVDLSYEDERLTSRAKGYIAKIENISSELTLKDINWNIPLEYPPVSKEKNNGEFKIQSIAYKNVETARLTGAISQIKDGFTYSSDLISKMDIAGQLQCDGTLLLNGNSTNSCTLPETLVDSSALPDYIVLPEETTFTGTLSAKATFDLNDTKQKGHLNVHLLNGMLSKGPTVINNVETTLSFPNLPDLQSAPGQLATIGSIESGKVQLQNGKFYYRIENAQQFFLEKARLDWCGGKVELGSLNINSDMKNLEATLYCDRLNFAKLLNQFGIKGTEGEGSLNGRLPIAISDTGINFDDGFLFSTPGNSGIVRFTNTDQLRQGMPDIDQSATLGYSVKALENFAYNWTKLTFNTEGEDLLLAMQLDGKPAEPLPFGYRNGQIVSTKKGPGLQHPVRLDMNFRLPLKDLFQSGKSLQSFMEKM